VQHPAPAPLPQSQLYALLQYVALPPQSRSDPQQPPPPLPAIIFFISVLLSLPCMFARLIFVVFIFYFLKFNKHYTSRLKAVALQFATGCEQLFPAVPI
jgi:hypothetical protein